ncbi:TetR/AcrR family transcriptional regulator [Jiangella asiatica]|uniref:TetR/AcrR family transcriptional regulator n=1 Tax=Jiangella asiatica TaxID=2530372 RepID=A0A4R5DQM2_9ACTN|nr:TetR/AcrR family transcriptional regulator [Jiangella asiatica]TDE15967.1 TetR/AcrR family transcriptional regulator [Jiangella asiatica]
MSIDEIKQTAPGLMREHSTTDFRSSGIARLIGMTAPALYRYVADRAELLTALIVDAYDDLGQAVAQARDRVPLDDPGSRFVTVAQAYRQWAKDEPQRFALILGLPVPGYHAPVEAPTTEAARRAMTQLKALFSEAARLGRPAPTDAARRRRHRRRLPRRRPARTHRRTRGVAMRVSAPIARNLVRRGST